MRRNRQPGCFREMGVSITSCSRRWSSLIQGRRKGVKSEFNKSRGAPTSWDESTPVATITGHREPPNRAGAGAWADNHVHSEDSSVPDRETDHALEPAARSQDDFRGAVSPVAVPWNEPGWLTRETAILYAERAALALTEAVTRLSDRPDPVRDKIWQEAARHHDEKALAAFGNPP